MTTIINPHWPPGSNARLLAEREARRKWAVIKDLPMPGRGTPVLRAAPSPSSVQGAVPSSPHLHGRAFSPISKQLIDLVQLCGETGAEFPSLTALAERFGVTIQTVCNRLRDLERQGIVAMKSWQPGGGAVSRRAIRVVATGVIARTANCPTDWVP